ncbi:MAG TPA: hypothetical protein VFB60_11810 [Ktedonobacteraceae bacterium]|nr:hypothetical protein [Ktedonobacteraceae bacterium]
MNAEQCEALELAALYDEKRDKQNTRLPVWSLLIGLFSIFGYAAFQSGLAGYIIICFPPLSACVGRFIGHSERVLNKAKRRIYKIEAKSDYDGYEHENEQDASDEHGSGSHLLALRDFVLLTDTIAIAAASARLIADHLAPLIAVLVMVEGFAIIKTCIWMRDLPAHKPPPQREDRSHRGTILPGA